MVTGEIPREGPRPGDPRCLSKYGAPCEKCYREVVAEYEYQGDTMPGCDPNNMPINPHTKLPYETPHPWLMLHPDWEKDGGVDMYGNRLPGGPQSITMKEYKYDENKRRPNGKMGDYKCVKNKVYDFGPQQGDKEYEDWMNSLPDDHEHKRKPLPELVPPNPWFDPNEHIPTPLEVAAEKVRLWAKSLDDDKENSGAL
eukprot:gnl/MRDRNA2_/MRDRNA2_113854_c0_seq1.p1 gnl/MRDRNA2_/MRDRNA2_113854_c0~~gnl/MRDRNA2_/MRDRNA2_113854_c0_seq1.p1  ORF type:complete len:198 (+),score=33.44 gnl/MRDRNA2_/MRDRNA2_113854_c0_seq1:106-699(+)